MPRFNTAVAPATTVNLAGGEAFAASPKLELAAIVLTSFLSDQFYRSADGTVARIRELIEALPDKRFAAQAALYARTEYGMRSVTHVVARELARVSGERWTAEFFDRIVRRPDDLTEILALYWADGDTPLPNAMKRGFARTLTRFDAYQLAKYRAEGKQVSLVDAVNMVRPKHTEAIAALVRGELKNEETWEARLSAAGSDAEAKAAQWTELISSQKIGYFALLRNLRNIIEQAPDAVDAACDLLVDESLIRTSLVLPFRFDTAMKAVLQATELDEARARRVITAVSAAVDISLANVPAFPGSTLVALDTSGSMMGRPLDIGALFAAVLYKASAADLLLFSDDAAYVRLNPLDATLSLAEQIRAKAKAAGTNFHAIFQEAVKRYARIIILSDMQGWMGHSAPTDTFAAYKKRTGADPHVSSFDLAGYGTLQFPERQVYAIAGFSEKVLELMPLLEEDRDALVHRIEAVPL